MIVCCLLHLPDHPSPEAANVHGGGGGRPCLRSGLGLRHSGPERAACVLRRHLLDHQLPHGHAGAERRADGALQQDRAPAKPAGQDCGRGESGTRNCS